MPADRRPDVTAVIPTHNRWHLLPLALRSVLAQEDVALDVIVVDDGSAEARGAEIEEDAVRLIRHKTAKGVAAARNAGLAEARGDWVAFLDDDDVWAPAYLRTLLDAAGAAGAEFAYSGAVEVDESFEVMRIPLTPEPDELTQLLLRHNAIPAAASNTFVRTDLMRSLGGFDAALLLLEDWDLWIRLALSARGAMSPEPLVGHLVHSGSIQVGDPENLLPAFEYVAAKHRAAARRHRAEPHGLAFSRYVARYKWRAGDTRAALRILIRGAFKYGSARGVWRGLRSLVRGEVSRAREEGLTAPTYEPPWLALYREAALMARSPRVTS